MIIERFMKYDDREVGDKLKQISKKLIESAEIVGVSCKASRREKLK